MRTERSEASRGREGGREEGREGGEENDMQQ